MKSLKLVPCLLGIGLAAPAFAGGLDTAVVEPAPQPVAIAPVAPSVADWSGAYVGLSLGSIGGSASDTGTNYDLDRSTAPGVFAGYNLQNGNLVYGAELSYAKPNNVRIEGDTSDGMGGLIDLSGRVGYATGRALVYGKLGYAQTSYDNGTTKADFDGMSYGVGVDYMATDRMTVGLNYTGYNLSSNDSAASGVDLDPAQVSLRVGFQF